MSNEEKGSDVKDRVCEKHGIKLRPVARLYRLKKHGGDGTPEPVEYYCPECQKPLIEAIDKVFEEAGYSKEPPFYLEEETEERCFFCKQTIDKCDCSSPPKIEEPDQCSNCSEYSSGDSRCHKGPTRDYQADYPVVKPDHKCDEHDRFVEEPSQTADLICPGCDGHDMRIVVERAGRTLSAVCSKCEAVVWSDILQIQKGLLTNMKEIARVLVLQPSPETPIKLHLELVRAIDTIEGGEEVDT